MSNYVLLSDLEQIKKFYEEAFAVLDKKRATPEIEVRFYPYIGVKSTIRKRNGKFFVRISEICREMPSDAQRGLAFVLVGDILKKKFPPEVGRVYFDFVKTQEMRAKAKADKRLRGRKIITSSKGEVYDLDKIFDDMNILYFKSAIPKPTLTWSARKTYRILGHYDPTHETIVISRSLDSKKVPLFVVAYIVYHEMLHIRHPITYRNGRRSYHPPAFRRDEQNFDYFDDAENWIERNVKNFKRNARRWF
jgi:hypothetical protein